MTDTTAEPGGTPNPADATTQNTGGAPIGEPLLTNGAAPGAEAKVDDANGIKTEPKEPDAKADDKGTEVPEKYDFKMPEGVELDAAAAEEFSVLAKELKLDQATAQKIADIGAKMAQKQAERHAETVKGWTTESKADKEFGGDNLQQNLAVAQKAIDTFGSKELKALLVSSGLGNHPEIIRFAYNTGKAISEDGFMRSGSRTSTPATSLEKQLYPNMN